jgi:cytochrome P450
MAPPVELQRWLLQSRNIPYEYRPRAAGLHALASRRNKVPIELPLILTPAGPVGGLRPSLAWFDEMRPEREALVPDRGHRALVDRLTASLFGAAVKSFYHHMLTVPGVLVPAAIAGTPLFDRVTVRLLRPLWVRTLRLGLGLADFDPAAAEARIDEAFASVEAALAGSGSFLAGDAPGDADIIFAVLASPVILPHGHPAGLPADGDLPPRFRALVERCRARPAGALAQRVYDSRPAPIGHGRVPRDRTGLAARLLSARVQRGLARWLARSGPRALSLRGSIFVSRWADVAEVLRRDGDFLIAPINAERIERVSGPFILGMDQSAGLQEQRAALYKALREADRSRIDALLAAEPDRVAEAAARRFGRIDVVNGYARPIAARTALRLFGVSGPSEQDLMRVARGVFQETFLNLRGDKAVQERGAAAGAELGGWIAGEVRRRAASGPGPGDLIDRLSEQVAAGTLAPEQLPWIVSGLLVGSIDTTATAVANIIEEIAADPAIAARVAADAGDPERLTGWCRELLRRRPHNPLLLRQARSETPIAGRTAAAGAKIWALTLAAMQDGSAFPNPAAMDPGRPSDRYMHFGFGLHRCSGRELNDIQIPALVRALVVRGASGPIEKRSRGPFPDRLVIYLRKNL